VGFSICVHKLDRRRRAVPEFAAPIVADEQEQTIGDAAGVFYKSVKRASLDGIAREPKENSKLIQAWRHEARPLPWVDGEVGVLGPVKEVEQHRGNKRRGGGDSEAHCDGDVDVVNGEGCEACQQPSPWMGQFNKWISCLEW
jgi:hypothetical protein